MAGITGIEGKSFTTAALEAAGVRRISFATSLYRAVKSGLIAATREVEETGTSTYIDETIATPELNGYRLG